MKRLLALILALIFCLGFVVSCGVYKDEDSNSREESCCISYTSKDGSEEEQQAPKVYPIPDDAYKTYKAKLKGGTLANTYDRVSLSSYLEYEEIMQTPPFAEKIDEITAETFVDNFVLILYRDNSYDSLNPFYRDLRKSEDGFYILNFEYTQGQRYSSDSYEFYFVVIPRAHCDSPSLLTNTNFIINKDPHAPLK